MRGLCDTCDQSSELFQLDGRQDRNCVECHTALRRTLELYETFRELERSGQDTSDLLPALRQVMGKLAARFRQSNPQASPAFN